MVAVERASVISDRRRWMEIGLVVLTGLGKIVFMDVLNWRLPFISIITIAWLVYISYRSRRDPFLTGYWGFRKDNFRKVLRLLLPFAIVFVGCFLLIGFFRDTINLTWHIFPVLIIYPVWGMIQQFLVIGLVAGNLKDLRKTKLHTGIVIFLTAILFGLIHYPYHWLMVGTFLLALLYGYIYLKEKNIFVLGLFHGWLGALFFYTVVERDPFLEVFGPLLLK